MEIEEALELFEEIVELCYDTANPKIIEFIEDIYSEVSRAKRVSKILSSLEELEVVFNEEDLTDDEEDFVDEIKEKIKLMSE